MGGEELSGEDTVGEGWQFDREDKVEDWRRRTERKDDCENGYQEYFEPFPPPWLGYGR